MRDSGFVSTEAVYLALGVTKSGVKELLGMWISPNAGGEILAFRDDGIAKPGCTEYFHRLR